MSLITNPAYKQYSEVVGPYLAVLEVANNAREIAQNLENRISDSIALDYAARGLIPDPKDFPDHRLDRVKDYISYIDNNELKQAIIDSYEESLKKYHLVYVYNNIYNEYDRSRIRIIMNILWDNRPHKKG